jgi:hypothetical protein
LSCNSSVCSGLSMDCDDDDDELHFSWWNRRLMIHAK